MNNENNNDIKDFPEFNLASGITSAVGVIERSRIDDPNVFPPEEELGKIPVVRITHACAFPEIPMTLAINNGDGQEKVISDAIRTSNPVVFLFADENQLSEGSSAGYSRVGVIGRIMKCIQLPEEEHKQLLCFGGPRVRVKKFNVRKSGITASLAYAPLQGNVEDLTMAAYMSLLHERYAKLIELNGNDPHHADEVFSDVSKPDLLAYTIAFQLPITGPYKNDILKTDTIDALFDSVLENLDKLVEMTEIRREMAERTHHEMQEEQKHAFLRQQLGLIRDELNEGDSTDINDFKKRAQEKKWNKETQEHFEREISKLERYPSNSPDYSIQYSYIDTLLNLPWENYSNAEYDLQKIEETLNRDHFGLERVKERILEQMAVSILRADNKSPILCLVGPPGVGKTSLGKSIADAMGREYIRVSFGGMHDEAEIRGHRRTYIGAMPGRIMAALAKKRYSNPVIVLDEIDKIGRDFKGDPSTALLELLDPEQNGHFHDNYIDSDYDLSNILFIATANSLETISAPLRDRMEIISIPGYITAEKVEIAKRHLIEKQKKASGLENENIEFAPEALTYIIDYYTRESGVRKLEKTISKVLRKLAVKKVRNQEFPYLITKEIVSELLGKKEFNPDMYESNEFTGVVTGLAWTQVGGEILFIESSVTEGKGNKLTLTGNLGDVMKESATLALQYLRAHATQLGLTTEYFDTHDVHIHVPEGAIPKDGPSAGITMATSLASAMTGRKVRSKLAMTGEITLRGKVLPVGGIKEKIIAAKRAGIEEIILSADNEKDILEVNERYVEGLTFHYVKTIDEVLERALL